MPECMIQGKVQKESDEMASGNSDSLVPFLSCKPGVDITSGGKREEV